jgi:hypothetical protein
MSNAITIELCAEDRARLDRIANAIEARTAQVERIIAEKNESVYEPETSDPVTEALAETLARVTDRVEAPKNATKETETSTPTTTPPEEEQPKDEEPTQPQPTKTVDHSELRAKVIELSAKGLKAQTRDIILAYAPTVKDVPDDKLNECYEKLVALEN